MRSIGCIADAAQARLFGDFLVTQGVANELEHEADGSWTVWVVDEHHLDEARAWLVRFQAAPHAPEFAHSAARATDARRTAAKEQEAYARRLRTRRSLFPKIGGYGVGVLTYALIVGCLIVAVYTKLGTDRDVLRHLFISDPASVGRGFLPEVFAGEVWRLLSPMLIHFGPLHLIFNLMWLYQLGCMIEARQRWGVLAALVVVSEIVSAVAQYGVGGPSFGGMSGVVYALAGYVWIRGRYDRASGLYLDPQSVIILGVWLVVCFLNVIGNVANTAHLAGLIVGAAWGGISAWFARKRPE